jgi:hypothetical protein
MSEFDDQELAPIEKLVEDIPESSRVHCLGVSGVENVFLRSPLQQSCEALVQLHTHGYAGSAFAGTGHNALRFTSSVPAASLGDVEWQRNMQSLSWDYLIVRGEHAKPRRDIFEAVSTVEETETSPQWTLYRVLHAADLPAEVVQLEVGGSGGTAGQGWCDDGRILEALAVEQRPEARALVAAQAECRRVRLSPGSVAFEGEVRYGPLFGEEGPSERLSCPVGRVIVGLHGSADTLVHSVGVVCLPWRDLDADEDTRARAVEPLVVAGRAKGEPFSLVCPPRTLVRGVTGRGGALVDSLGIACARPPESSVVEREPTP